MKKLSLYITLALVSLVFGACSDEYEPWGNPQAYPEEGAVTIPGMKANAVATQDLGTAGEQVSLFTLTAATLPERPHGTPPGDARRCNAYHHQHHD